MLLLSIAGCRVYYNMLLLSIAGCRVYYNMMLLSIDGYSYVVNCSCCCVYSYISWSKVWILMSMLLLCAECFQTLVGQRCECKCRCYCCVQSIFKHWLDKGVDAVYVSDVHVLYESDDLQLDEPLTDDDSKSTSVCQTKCLILNYTTCWVMG